MSCVLPTPVGPKKINDDRGLLAELNPALDLLIALETSDIGFFWPKIFSESILSILENFFYLIAKHFI